jgi:hypothetical protein
MKVFILRKLLSDRKVIFFENVKIKPIWNSSHKDLFSNDRSSNLQMSNFE